MTAIIGLIRHGLTAWNLEKRIQGSRDIPLCDEGRKQAASWGKRLAPLSFDRIVTSPQRRASETAAIIARDLGLECKPEPAFREQDFGEWEGHVMKKIRKAMPLFVKKEEAKGWQFCPPKGESRIAVYKRALTAIEQTGIQYRRQRILVVTHSAVTGILFHGLMKKDFVSEPSPIIKPYHLHMLKTSPATAVSKINALDLSSKNSHTKESSGAE